MVWDFRDVATREEALRKLSEYATVGTHLVSLYVSKNPALALQRIRSEEARLGNIKSKLTQKVVGRALARIAAQLKANPEPPFVIFATEEESFLCSLPSILARDDYVCDKKFDIASLINHSDSKWGLILSDTLETTLGVWQNGRIAVLDNHEYTVPGKIKAGGQSAQRFQETRMNRYAAMIEDVVCRINSCFLDKGYSRIFLGGTSPTIEKLMNHPGIDRSLKPLIIGPFSVCYTSPEGLGTLVQRASEDCKEIMSTLHQEQATFRQLVQALTQGRAGGLEQLRGIPLEKPRYFLVNGLSYIERYCFLCKSHNTPGSCMHATVPLASLPSTYKFQPGERADFIRNKYRGLVSYAEIIQEPVL